MAKVLPYYSLSPLIEQKSFIGLTSDAESNCAIVTVNSNIISRYIIANPKQISSWNTKGNLTCAVNYDQFKSEYVGIFNSNEIRCWSLETQNIDKVRKYRFVDSLHSILNIRGRSIVVFKNGYFTDLETAIEHRKIHNKTELNLFEHDEFVRSAEWLSCSSANDVIFISFLTEKNGKTYRLHLIPYHSNANDSNNDNVRALVFNFRNRIGDSEYVCHCFLSDKNCSLLTLWTDRKLFLTKLYYNNNTNTSNPERQFPGQLLTELPSYVSTDCSVLMCSLSDSDVAIYCSTTNESKIDEEEKFGEQRALLLLFTVKYNLVQQLASYKSFPNPPYFSNLGSNLFLIIGHNLVVVPYTLKNQKLSTLLGTIASNDSEDDRISECKLAENLILKLLKENDLVGLLNTMNTCIDISDDVIINVLIACLSSDLTVYRDVLRGLIVRHSLTDASKLGGISFQSSLILIDELSYHFSTADVETQLKLIKWISSILDIFYPQYLLTDDSIIKDRLVKLKHNLNAVLKIFDDYNDTLMLLHSKLKLKEIYIN